jgi:hypothetical protein
MNEERDSILRIRAKVDGFDEWEESKARMSPPPTSVNHADTRIVLCSPRKLVKVIHVSVTEAPLEFNLKNFDSRLARFFEVYSDVEITRQRLKMCAVGSDHYLLAYMANTHHLDPSLLLNAYYLRVHDECHDQI